MRPVEVGTQRGEPSTRTSCFVLQMQIRHRGFAFVLSMSRYSSIVIIVRLLKTKAAFVCCLRLSLVGDTPQGVSLIVGRIPDCSAAAVLRYYSKEHLHSRSYHMGSEPLPD